jgi:nitroreductase
MAEGLQALLRRSRSCRRFRQEHAVELSTLMELVELARLSPSGGNLQPLKFVLSSDPARNSRIFSCLKWAGYLRDWPGPEEGERPAAYIVVLGDRAVGRRFDCDLGIAAQSIMLGAREKGLGGCMIRSCNRKALGPILGVAEGHSILMVIALGKPKEEVTLETVGPDGDVRYWRDERGVHHVPKRRREDIVLACFGS